MLLLVMLADQVLGANCKARFLRAGANILVLYATQSGKGCVLRTGSLRSLRNWMSGYIKAGFYPHSHTYPSGEHVRFVALPNQGDAEVAIKHRAPAAAPQEDNLTFTAFHHLL